MPYMDKPRQNLDRTHCIDDPSQELDRTIDPRDPPPVPADFTLAQGVAHVIAQLTPADRAYAKKTAKKTGCTPFSALHDLCDANMLLPIRGGFVDCSDQPEADYLNAVMEGVNGYLNV